MDLKPELIELLACPQCKSSVKESMSVLICQNKDCGLQYPVRDGIPVMLISEATPKD